VPLEGAGSFQEVLAKRQQGFPKLQRLRAVVEEICRLDDFELKLLKLFLFHLIYILNENNP
jgi:hypothetical protein